MWRIRTSALNTNKINRPNPLALTGIHLQIDFYANWMRTFSLKQMTWRLLMPVCEPTMEVANSKNEIAIFHSKRSFKAISHICTFLTATKNSFEFWIKIFSSLKFSIVWIEFYYKTRYIFWINRLYSSKFCFVLKISWLLTIL